MNELAEPFAFFLQRGGDEIHPARVKRLKQLLRRLSDRLGLGIAVERLRAAVPVSDGSLGKHKHENGVVRELQQARLLPQRALEKVALL